MAAPSALRAQSWQWANVGGGSQNDLVGGVAVDSAGNSYVVGTFENNIAFGSTIFTDGANTGLFLAKYSAGGVLQWATQGIGTGNFINPGIAVGRTGDVFITGGFNGNVRFGADTLKTTGAYDIFVAKFSTAGVVQWAHSDGRGVGSAYGRGVAIDNAQNAYVTGFYADTARFDTIRVTSKGMNDVFVAKYDNNGVLQWIGSAGGSQNDESYGIGVDGSRNSYITGQFSDSAFYGSDTIVSSGGTDPFVAKFSDIGAPTWGTQMGGRFGDKAWNIAVDQFGNSYVTGEYSDTAYFGATRLVSQGSTDIFLAKVDGVGEPRWAVTAGGTLQDAGQGVTVDDLGAIYITGHYADSAHFSGTLVLDTARTGEIFVAKYDGSGLFQWVRTAGGTGYDEGRAIAVDHGQELRVGGAFSTAARFGTTTLPSTGRLDAFVAKLGANPTIAIGAIIERTFCPGDQFQVPFSVKGVFDVGNFFTVQLSDSSGSFDSTVNIGKVFGVGGTIIYAKIPDSVITGTHYRIRVVSSSPVAISNLNEFPLEIYSAPVAAVSPAGPIIICKGETVTLDAGAGFGSYLWITGETTRMIAVSRSGNFSVTVSNGHGCSATSKAVNVTVVTAAKPVISHTGTTLESTPAVMYKWNLDGSPLNGDTSRTLSITQQGAYTVQITDSNGCTAVSDPYQYTGSGVPQDRASGTMAIYPHPNAGLFTVTARLPRTGMVTVSVVDALGKVVASSAEEATSVDFSRPMDIQKEPAGLYFVRIECAGIQWVREVVKR